MIFTRKIAYIAKLSLLLLIMSILTKSCETVESEPVYAGDEYFPLAQGKWMIYEVDSTVYDDFLGEVFRYNYQVKEVFSEVRETGPGEINMKIERFIRLNDEKSWMIKNVWTTSLEKRRATRTEDNITFVKLVFPLKANLAWNGNVYNTYQSQNYRITSIHQPWQNKQLDFDSTLTVLQRHFTTLIGEEYQYEIYAAGVGMVEKKFVLLEKEIDGRIKRGVDYSYILLEAGMQ